MDETAFYVRESQLDRFATVYAVTPDGLVAEDKPQTSGFRDPERPASGGGV